MIEVFNPNFQRIAILEKAFDIGYTLENNKLSTATFALTIKDPKNEYCTPFNYIKLFDGAADRPEYVDMFVIMPMETVKNENTSQITYNCEQVLGTLLNKVLFRYHEIGGIGTYTADIINFLLSGQNHWRLGRCDFRRQFQYSFENTTILSALFSIPNTFDEEYLFTWDTVSYPWTLNLIRPPTDVRGYLRYGRNMKGIQKVEDASAVCTRLYALGSGEGVNQLSLEASNPTGLPYIDADTIADYGLVEKIWTDLRYQLPDNLYAAAHAKLERIKRPKLTYTIDAAEFWRLTGLETDRLMCGDVIRVIDDELGLDTRVRVVRKTKANIENDNISATIDISSDGDLGGGGLSDLYERARINETTAQGATNIVPYNFHQNADTSYPARLRFKIPVEAVYINKVELSFQSSAFQAYSKAIKDGGGGTVWADSDGGGDTSQTQDESVTTPAKGSQLQPTALNKQDPDIKTYHTNADVKTGTHYGSTGRGTTDDGYYYEAGRYSPHDHSFEVNVVIPGWTEGHEHWVKPKTHIHDYLIPGHDHTFIIKGHKHTIGDHDHRVRLRDHRHDIDYGIFQGPSASGFTLKVDNNPVPISGTVNDLDIIQYLSKDGNSGRISRGWHELIITPDNMCMLDAQLNVQTFINSRGGGNF